MAEEAWERRRIEESRRNTCIVKKNRRGMGRGKVDREQKVTHHV